MATAISNDIQGVHPYFLGLGDPVDFAWAASPWKVRRQGGNHWIDWTPADGKALSYRLPSAPTVNGSEASVDLGFGVARWTAFASHLKFTLTFNAKPSSLVFDQPTNRTGLDFVSDGGGGLDVMSGTTKVGALPRPWLDDAEGTRHWLSWTTTASGIISLVLPTLSSDALWVGAVLDPTTIDTSSSSSSTAYSNQRKIDRCQNGNLWATFWNGTSTTTTSMEFWYSSDNGATWTNPGTGSYFGFASTGTTYVPNASLFIDLDDYAHVAYKDRSDGQVKYRRGTPNAGRTAWTWSAAVSVATNTTLDYPDLIAHREGTGWAAHVVVSNNNTSFNINSTNFYPFTISSTGTISMGTALTIGGSYGNTNPTYPSIDFNHTGDAKTVAGSTPHLYAAWSAGASGAGKGIRFRKATYSAGAWTWETEREIDSTSFANAGRISSIFDGTRVVIAYADSQSTSAIKVRERDAADTTTTTRTPTALSDGVVLGVTTSYDANGNIRLGAIGTTSLDPTFSTYNRSANTWGAWTAYAASARADTLSAKRGYSNNRVEFVYTDLTASPYNVRYDSILLPITHTVAGALAGTGTTTSHLTIARLMGAALQGAGALNGTVHAVHQASALLAAEGNLGGALAALRRLEANLVGAGLLAANFETLDTISADLAGVATLEGALRRTQHLSAALAGAATVGGAAIIGRKLHAELAGHGAVTAAQLATSRLLAGTSLSGVGRLEGATPLRFHGSFTANLAGTAEVTGRLGGLFTMAADLMGAGDVDGAVSLLRGMQADLVGAAHMEPRLQGGWIALAANLVGAGVVDANLHRQMLVAAALSGRGWVIGDTTYGLRTSQRSATEARVWVG
jgi:hypothetical protein